MLLSKDSHSIYNLHPIVSIFLLLGLHLAILYFLYFIRYFVNIHTKSIDLNQELIKAVNQYEKFRLDYNMNDLINSIPELQMLVSSGPQFDLNISSSNFQLEEGITMAIITYNNGGKYIGYWNNEKRATEGYGLMYVPGANYQIGYFLNGTLHGRGQIMTLSGNRLEGNWEYGQLNGKGRMYTNSYDQTGEYGMLYEGDFVNHKKEGFGVTTWHSGESFEGNWVNNKKEGFGKYIGTYIFEGQFKNDMRNGYGILYHETQGMRYEGEFVNNKKEGYGTLILRGEKIYEGQFVNDQANNMTELVENCLLVGVDPEQEESQPSYEINQQIELF